MAKVISVRCTYTFNSTNNRNKNENKKRKRNKKEQHNEARHNGSGKAKMKMKNQFHSYFGVSIITALFYFLISLLLLLLLLFIIISFVGCARGQRISLRPSSKPASRTQHMDAYLMYTLNEIDYIFSCSVGSIFNSSIVCLVCVRVRVRALLCALELGLFPLSSTFQT